MLPHLNRLLAMASDGAGAAGDAGGGGDAGGAGGAGGGAGGAGAEGGAGGAGGAGAAAGSAAAYYEAFGDNDLKTHPSVHRYKTPEELAKAYVNLEKRFGVNPDQRIDLPTDPNDKAAMRAVFSKLGLPEKPEGYGMALDDKATDADRAMLGDFTTKAHELGLPADMAKGVMDFWMGKVGEAQAAQVAAQEARATEGKATLAKEWGAAQDSKTKEVTGLLEKYGEGTGLTKENLHQFPQVALMLGKMVDRMAEPGVMDGKPGEMARGGFEGQRLSPAQAGAALRSLEADPIKSAALFDNTHAMHASVIAERNRLSAMRDGKDPDAIK